MSPSPTSTDHSLETSGGVAPAHARTRAPGAGIDAVQSGLGQTARPVVQESSKSLDVQKTRIPSLSISKTPALQRCFSPVWSYRDGARDPTMIGWKCHRRGTRLCWNELEQPELNSFIWTLCLDVVKSQECGHEKRCQTNQFGTKVILETKEKSETMQNTSSSSSLDFEGCELSVEWFRTCRVVWNMFFLLTSYYHC